MYCKLMKTLIKPQAKFNIATTSYSICRDKVNSNYLYSNSIKSKFLVLPIFLSFIFVLFFPEAPQKNSQICTKNFSEQVCNIF